MQPCGNKQAAGNKMSKEELMEELMAKLKDKLLKGQDQVRYLRWCPEIVSPSPESLGQGVLCEYIVQQYKKIRE